MYAEVEKTGKYIQEESIYVQSDRSGKPERALCASGTCSARTEAKSEKSWKNNDVL